MPDGRAIRKKRRISSEAFIVFCIALSLCAILNGYSIRHRLELERLKMEQLVDEKAAHIVRVLSRLLHKTQALAALVIQSNGQITNFNRVAATIVDDPCILNILLAPGGVVREVYPLHENEAVLGFDMFGDSAGNREAIMARDSGELVFGGPFTTVQGIQTLVGRLPVYLPQREGGSKFWGMVSVTLRYPQALQGAGLEQLDALGFAYELWRISPDTNQRQIIAHSPIRYNQSVAYMERPLELFNAEWHFRILPVRAWYEYPEAWALILVGVCLSVLLACIVQNNRDLSRIHRELEAVVNTDPLTGLLNRKGLFDELERLIDDARHFQLYYIDINGLKTVNDTFGHHDGDAVLTRFSATIRARLDERFLFARTGGDEFILVHIGERDLDGGQGFWDTVRDDFARPFRLHSGATTVISFSRGIAAFPSDGSTLDELIAHADEEMYRQKQAYYAGGHGRRRTD